MRVDFRSSSFRMGINFGPGRALKREEILCSRSLSPWPRCHFPLGGRRTKEQKKKKRKRKTPADEGSGRRKSRNQMACTTTKSNAPIVAIEKRDDGASSGRQFQVEAKKLARNNSLRFKKSWWCKQEAAKVDPTELEKLRGNPVKPS